MVILECDNENMLYPLETIGSVGYDRCKQMFVSQEGSMEGSLSDALADQTKRMLIIDCLISEGLLAESPATLDETHQ